MSNFKVNGYTINSIADFDALLAETDTKTMQIWGRPLSVESLRFLLHRIKERTKSESVSSEIDARLRKLAENTSIPQLFIQKTESEKQLAIAQQKRDERLREMGYDISGDDGTDKEPTEAMKATWKKREKRQEMYER
ncbi:MAG: hypothetical protein IBV52_08440 [Candidatus Bathyarchaeota archaeon]